MIRFYVHLVLLIFSLTVPVSSAADEEPFLFRLNQVGFLPGDLKTAVLLSTFPLDNNQCYITRVEDDEIIFTVTIPGNNFAYGDFYFCTEIDFSELKDVGEYYLTFGEYKSYNFKIGNYIFNAVRDSLSMFFKVQRCGPTNPILHQVCHLSDVAKVIGYPDTIAFDVTGGWHDAGDYIKFFSTAAYTTYMLLFSYEFDKEKFGYDLDGNEVPDILEEARVGLDWLLRCRFNQDLFITQVQDLSDHNVGWRLPEHDTLRYNRPGYAGIGKNQTGIYAAVMSLASRIWREKFFDIEFADNMLNSALEMYNLNEQIPDVDSTESGFYQDFDHLGKTALGAIELFISTKNQKFYDKAVALADSAKSDYWWSWGNINSLAHFKIAQFNPEYITYIRNNLDHYSLKSSNSIFREATEYTWGTTNSFLGASLQSILYKKLTEKNDYDSLMIFQRDFVLGRNAWGVSFIYNIGSSYSKNLHSQVGFFNNGYLPGALSSGPAPISILNEHKLTSQESIFNTSETKYYDDFMNYITNEPTIVGNATALFVFGYFSSI
ncbi:MAG: glycoside hydrolase family 9 protein [Ignavibacteriaceae bacterium]